MTFLILFLSILENEDNENLIQKKKLTPLQLAMGEQMIYSKKRSRDIEDWAWNRLFYFLSFKIFYF